MMESGGILWCCAFFVQAYPLGAMRFVEAGLNGGGLRLFRLPAEPIQARHQSCQPSYGCNPYR
jgi:hypothetical protein